MTPSRMPAPKSRPMSRRLARPLARAGVVLAAAVGALLTAAAAASAGNGFQETSEPGPGLSVVETLGLYLLAPAVIFGLIALVVVGPSLGKGPRHRTGAALETGPVWIDGSGTPRRPAASNPDAPATTDQGGTSAHW